MKAITDNEREDLIHLIDEWEDDPDGAETCDNLCYVSARLGLPNDEYRPDYLRRLAGGGRGNQ